MKTDIAPVQRFHLARLLFTILTSFLTFAPRVVVAELQYPTAHELAAIAAADGLRLWYHEEEFRRDPLLRARPHQVVILHLAGASKQQRFLDHTIPYLFVETATYTFCIPKKEPFLEELTLTREGNATPVVQLKRGHKCQTREIAAGLYRLQVRHDGKDIGPEGEKAFIHVPRFRGAVLTENAQTPKTAVSLATSTASSLPACDPANSLNNALFMLTVGNGKFISDSGPKVSTQSTPPDALGGWYICPDGSGNYTIFQTGGPTTFAASGPPSTDTTIYINYPATPFKLTDLGNDQFTLAANFGGALYPVVLGADNVLHWAPLGTPPAVFTIALKYYPLTGVAQPLLPGEAAFFQSCNYNVSSTGTWVFTTTTIPNLGAFHAFGVSLDNTVASVKLGPQTLATLYANTNLGGTAQLVGQDIPCLSSTPLGVNTASSLQVTPARQFFLAGAKQCLNCNLSGVDLSDIDLSGGQFQGSTFTGANLTNTILQGATLDNANLDSRGTVFAGANFISALFHCTNFSGADLSSALVAFSGINPIVTTDFSCRVDLSSVLLNLSTFPKTQWRYFNLDSAKINDVQGASLSTATSPLNLSGAILNRVQLTNVVLDGATLGCVSTTQGSICTQLKGTDLTSASLKKANLAGALLNGAKLDNANLDGATLCGADLTADNSSSGLSASLSGAFLRNVNLFQANLTGAYLASANFYSTGLAGSCAPTDCGFTPACASAVNATMNNTDFTGAYLAGVDFSGSQSSLKAAIFTNALLMGSNFDGANLSQNTATGQSTKFTRAWLQGATFENADVSGAIFTNAIIDPDPESAGVRVQVQLDATHTSFLGYTPSAGSTLGCVKFTTDGPTEESDTDNTNTCPDGNLGVLVNNECSQDQWQSQSPPLKALPPPASSTCTVDSNWTKAQ